MTTSKDTHETARRGWMSRRDVAKLLGIGGAALAAGLPDRVHAQARRNTLVIGIDISDTVTLDPARQAQYTPPMSLLAAYDMLVTMAPGDYITIRPQLATKWERTPDGKGWRFTLRDNVKFASGNVMTSADVKWSMDRVLHLGDQTSQYISHVERTEVVDAKTVDIILKDPTQPLLTIIAAPGFPVYDSKLVMQHGGDASPEAKTKDKATAWLNENSAGAGAYRVTRWERNAQIQFVRNDNYWRGRPPFERVIIRHIGDSAAQLLSIRRSDVDIAFNLIPEQIATIKSDPNIRLEALTSLDFVYMALTQNAEFNKALAVKEARQAIGQAIDYDGIIKNLLGGAAVRCANFLPIGVSGSTEAIAKEIGFNENLDKARQLLQKAGLADGFEFDIAYGNAAIAGVTYQTLAQKIQADLARVNIRAKLTPMDQVNLRTTFTGNRAQGGVLTFWNPPAVENLLWAAASVERVARRVHWPVPPEVLKLVRDAAAEQDARKQADLWVEYQKRVVDNANYFILFQPSYQVAVRSNLAKLPLTAAGWMLDMYDVKPVSS
jgi:peptide/nickel transport system substrate-binding protein